MAFKPSQSFYQCCQTGLSFAAFLVLIPITFSDAATLKVGVVGNAQGTVTATAVDGTQRPLKSGDDIFQNDIIRTDAAGRAQVLFQDKSALTLTPGSEVKIDSFVYDPSSTQGDLSLQEVKGAFRFIGGALSKENHVEIKTPVSTIGIRGGIEETHISPKGDGAEAIFVYGHDMTVKDKAGVQVVVTQPGAGVSVQAGLPAPVAMSPATVEHKLEQFNTSATKGTPTDSAKSGTDSGDTNGDSKRDKKDNDKNDKKENAKDNGKEDAKGKGSDSSGNDNKGSDNKSGGNGGGANGTSSNPSPGGNSFANPSSIQNSNITSSIGNLTQSVTNTASTNATQQSTQQNSGASGNAFTYNGLYTFQGTDPNTFVNQRLTGKNGFFSNSEGLRGHFKNFFTSGDPLIVTLPKPGATGFKDFTLANDLDINGREYIGAVYGTQSGSMYYYGLEDIASLTEITAVTGTTIESSNWAAAANATIAASQAAGTNTTTFYHILPELTLGANNLSDLQDFISTASSSTLSSTDDNGHSRGGNIAVDWSRNIFFGGGVNWNDYATGSGDKSKLFVAFGNINTSGSSLAYGTVFDYSDSNNNVFTAAQPQSSTGFVRTTSYIYGAGGNGPIDGFVLEGVESGFSTSLPSDPFQTTGTHIFAPATQIAPSATAAASTASVTSGTLNGYAAGPLIYTDGTPHVQANWNTSLDDVKIVKNAPAGQLGANITVHDIDTPAITMNGQFGTSASAKSALLNDQIFAAQQGSTTFFGTSTVTDSTLQSGAIVSANVSASVEHSCSNCDFVQWGVWAGQSNSGTIAAPVTKVADLIPFVVGQPTSMSSVIGSSSINTLGPVTYTGALYGNITNTLNNTLVHQDGSFTSVINLSTRYLNNFNATLGTLTFGTSTPTPLTGQTYAGGSAAGFNNIIVTGGGGENGTINGTLFGPNAENVGGNFDVSKTITQQRATGIYLGGRPH